MKQILTLILFACVLSVSAQVEVTGLVINTKSKPIEGAEIRIEDSKTTTTSYVDGTFILKTSQKVPFTILISKFGFLTQKIQITDKKQRVEVLLKPELNKFDQIVVSASRAPERLFESPVTVERLGAKGINKAASPNFFDELENLKGVHMNTSSANFKSINTKGFADVLNTRFMQLVDGMDNSSPMLNIVLGNLTGLSDIDVESVEILPGASSALYGANAFNGILFLNSKNPFDYQGITANAKYGYTNQKAAGLNAFSDYSVRLAKAFSKKFAVKVNLNYSEGTDWYATDERDIDLTNNVGRDRSFHGYNGINVYGDEASTNINNVADGLLAGNLINTVQHAYFKSVLPNENVSRTGYDEVDLTDYKLNNAKANVSLHFRPWANDVEFILESRVGVGSTMYQGSNRYQLKDFLIQQHKFEVKGDNFFIRSYFTTEGATNSYDLTFTGLNINRAWKSDATWFGEYASAYATSYTGNSQAAHDAARLVADTGRYLPGTTDFKNAFKNVTSEADVNTGSKLVDNSSFYHTDANYNFKNQIKWAEFQMGGSYRMYDLNSFGRIYTDLNSPITYDEYGIYTQVQKKFLKDRAKFTGSVRYDKSQNFDGNFSPRASIVYSIGKERNTNFRASFQRGFKNPSTQDQYIGFNAGSFYLLGSAPDNLSRFSETIAGYTIDGNDAYYNSYTNESVELYYILENTDRAAAAALLKKTNVKLVRPEIVDAFEFGIRSQSEKLTLDADVYYNIYNHFIGSVSAIAPLYGTAQDGPDSTIGSSDPGAQSVDAISNRATRAFRLYTNYDVEIKSIGFGLGLTYRLPANFDIGASYNYADLDFDPSVNPSFQSGFNTPKHRAKASFSNAQLFKNFGFNVSARWNDAYKWQSNFVVGEVQAATVIDAQINYALPSLKSIIKLGATNIGGQEYQQVLGSGMIGQQFYGSLIINP
jgi:outer membrane receptor protein involved in Fe transport